MRAVGWGSSFVVGVRRSRERTGSSAPMRRSLFRTPCRRPDIPLSTGRVARHSKAGRPAQSVRNQTTYVGGTASGREGQTRAKQNGQEKRIKNTNPKYQPQAPNPPGIGMPGRISPSPSLARLARTCSPTGQAWRLPLRCTAVAWRHGAKKTSSTNEERVTVRRGRTGRHRESKTRPAS